MIKPIYLYGSEVLRQIAEPADLSRKETILQLIQDLKDTLQVADGCGLAAPQIGVSLRVLIVDGNGLADTYPDLKGFSRVMINPVIMEESPALCEYEEGCLSVPGIYGNVQRAESIRLEYYDENFERRTETFDKFACRMIQHEMSHLDGVLFTDLMSPIRRKMSSKKLQNISKGRVATRYNSKIK